MAAAYTDQSNNHIDAFHALNSTAVTLVILEGAGRHASKPSAELAGVKPSILRAN